MKPLAIDLYAGLGGWTEGLLAEGYDVIGFDIEKHEYGEAKYPAQLVLQDVRMIHGKQFKDASLIVASSPCQKYSYMAMPWTKAKDLRRWYLDPAHSERLDELNELFNQPLRIQREACEAAGRFIPMVQENVRGAQEWVGRSRWNFGSFHLWGDVPALMPIAINLAKLGGGVSWRHPSDPKFTPGLDFTRLAGQKNTGGSWFGIQSGKKIERNDPRYANNPARGIAIGEGTKQGGDWFNKESGNSISRRCSSKSKARKAASAAIAKIPFPLSQYIARYWKPI